MPLASAAALKARVLFVDDEPELLEALRRTLSRRFEIHTEVDAERALATLRDEAPFAVIVSDMRMPKMEGTRFLRAAKERAMAKFVYLYTGGQMAATPEAVLLLGCLPERNAATMRFTPP